MILLDTAVADRKGKLVAAINALESATALDPDFIEAHYQLGLTVRQFPARAEAAFRRVVELNPAHAAAHFQLGLLLERNDRAWATLEFQRAVELAPSLAEAHLALGLIAAATRDWATAVAEYQAALAWRPEDAATHLALVRATRQLSPKH